MTQSPEDDVPAAALEGYGFGRVSLRFHTTVRSAPPVCRVEVPAATA